MKKPKLSNYKKDKYYPKVVSAVDEILKKSIFVAPVEVFIRIGNLSRKDYENWRFGRVPYLEQVIRCNLSAIVRILRIIKFHAEECGLKPSWTFYKKWGLKNKPKDPLRFSKFRNPVIEEFFSTHYVAEPGKKLTFPEEKQEIILESETL